MVRIDDPLRQIQSGQATGSSSACVRGQGRYRLGVCRHDHLPHLVHPVAPSQHPHHPRLDRLGNQTRRNPLLELLATLAQHNQLLPLRLKPRSNRSIMRQYLRLLLRTAVRSGLGQNPLDLTWQTRSDPNGPFGGRDRDSKSPYRVMGIVQVLP